MSEPTKNQRYRFWYDVHCEGHWEYLTVKDVTPSMFGTNSTALIFIIR